MAEPAKIPFSEASNCEIPFGKNRGSTIDEVATSDEGLLYLDWLYGEMAKQAQTGVKAHFYDRLKSYMEDESIKKELEALKEDRRH